MQRLECPIGDCGSAIEAETDDEVIAQAAEHVQDHHPEVEIDDEMEHQLRQEITTV